MTYILYKMPDDPFGGAWTRVDELPFLRQAGSATVLRIPAGAVVTVDGYLGLVTVTT